MDDEKELRGRFNAASANVKKCLRMKSGGSDAEAAYANVYAALVKAGLEPKLARRYR